MLFSCTDCGIEYAEKYPYSTKYMKRNALQTKRKKCIKCGHRMKLIAWSPADYFPRLNIDNTLN